MGIVYKQKIITRREVESFIKGAYSLPLFNAPSN